MRILHIGKYFPPSAGGMETFLSDLVGAQRLAGHDVSVLVHGEPGQGANDPAWLMRCPVLVKLAFAPISPMFPFWLARAIRRFRPDVLHLHMPNVSAFWALMITSARAIPWVIHWQSDIETRRRPLSLGLLYPHYRIFERALLERAEAVIATSPQYLDSSAALQPWREKCTVIPLGVAPERLPEVHADTGDAHWMAGRVRLLAIGRLTYYKDFETLVRAVSVCRGVELLIVGEGEERGRLQATLNSLGNPGWIKLLGYIPDPVCHELLASCDVYCLPSCERTESFGIVMMEAMRYGKPLIASDLPDSGVSWIARRDVNAVLVPPGDSAAWAAAVARLAAEPGTRLALGGAGEAIFRAELPIAEVAKKLDVVYQRVCDLTTTRSICTRSEPLIVVPAWNEADAIGAVLQRIAAAGFRNVLVVDDGSTDSTAVVARGLGAQVLRAPLKQGAWGAMQTGIRYALRHGYTGVVTLDADGQHAPEFIPDLLGAATDADVVIGAYPDRGSRARHVAWTWFRKLTGFALSDLTSGMRFYNRQACILLAGKEATLIDYQDVGVLILLRRAGLRIKEVEVKMEPRARGASKVFPSWWSVTRYMTETTLLCLARWNVRMRT